jgi:5'-nucleotidase
VGGVKVGIFGVLLGRTKYSSKPGPDVYFVDTCLKARELVPQMRAQGAQVVVALTHLFVAEDKVLARCAPIDLIIGGHEHELMQAVSNGTPIVKMSSEARELGRVTLHVGTQSRKLKSMDFDVLPVSSEVPEDPAFAAAMREYDTLLAELSQTPARSPTACTRRTSPPSSRTPIARRRAPRRPCSTEAPSARTRWCGRARSPGATCWPSIPSRARW